jgi:hypothetical protein
MQSTASSASVFYVSPTPQGAWAVFGSEISPPLSTFAARVSAVVFACDQADRAQLGEVQVLAANGSVEEYLIRESLSEDRPAYRRAVSPISRSENASKIGSRDPSTIEGC